MKRERGEFIKNQFIGIGCLTSFYGRQFVFAEFESNNNFWGTKLN